MTPDAVLAAIEADRVRWLDHVPTCVHDTTGRGRCADCCEHMSAAAAVAALWAQGDAPAQCVAFDAVTAEDAVALLMRDNAALRDREQEVADLDALVHRQGALLLATADALKGPPPPLSQHSAHDLPEVAARLCSELVALKAQVAAAQPVPLDFYGALDAVRRGRFVADDNADRAQLAALTGADLAAQYPYAAAGVAHKSEVPK